MTNERNARTVRRYLEFLREAKGNDEATINVAASAIADFERFFMYADFCTFSLQAAVSYKDDLRGRRTRLNTPLSKATLLARCNRLRAFFGWLADQPGYKSRVSYSDAKYFALTAKEVRVATAERQRPSPTPEQLLAAFKAMPSRTDVELRDRAVVALIALTGVRDGALVSLKLKHLRIDKCQLDQDARSVETKFSKSFTTWFFPVEPCFYEELVRWCERRVKVHRAGGEDPIFPATKTEATAAGEFQTAGLDSKRWSDAGPVRRIFRQAFARVSLPNFNPHSVRNMLALMGTVRCRDPESLKAWSQNLGHEHMLTTWKSYGSIPPFRQQQIFNQLRSADRGNELGGDLAQVLRVAADQVERMRLPQSG
jgi:integrase